MSEDTPEPAPAPEKKPELPTAWGSKSAAKPWTASVRGDDPSVRVVHPPLATGIGTGKAFFFLFGFKRASSNDQQMLARELAEIDDDIEVLRNAGYTVVVDPQATREDFTTTIYGEAEQVAGLIPAGFYWSAHGHADGGIECCDGALIRPADIDPSKVSPGLRLAIFGACYVGSRSPTWRRALGGHPLVVGWGRPVTIDRAVDFLQPDDESNTDLDDLIARWLVTDEPLPQSEHDRASLPPPASSRGRIGELSTRIATLAEMLGARWREQGNHLQLEVPLAERRSHFVDVFLLDASEPFCEGELLFGAEANVGEMSALTDVTMLLAGSGHAGYGRIALVASETDMPRIVSQAFLPFARASNQDLAAQVYQVAAKADALEHTIFGGDAG